MYVLLGAGPFGYSTKNMSSTRQVDRTKYYRQSTLCLVQRLPLYLHFTRVAEEPPRARSLQAEFDRLMQIFELTFDRASSDVQSRNITASK